MQAIIPYLNFNGNCQEALDFYIDALDGKLGFKTTYGENATYLEGGEASMTKAEHRDFILHASVVSGPLRLMLSDCANDLPAPNDRVTLNITLFDPDVAKKLFDKLSAGGKVVMDYQKTFWAESYGLVTDKFGYTWGICLFKQDGDH